MYIVYGGIPPRRSHVIARTGTNFYDKFDGDRIELTHTHIYTHITYTHAYTYTRTIRRRVVVLVCGDRGGGSEEAVDKEKEKDRTRRIIVGDRREGRGQRTDVGGGVGTRAHAHAHARGHPFAVSARLLGPVRRRRPSCACTVCIHAPCASAISEYATRKSFFFFLQTPRQPSVHLRSWRGIR